VFVHGPGGGHCGHSSFQRFERRQTPWWGNEDMYLGVGVGAVPFSVATEGTVVVWDLWVGRLMGSIWLGLPLLALNLDPPALVHTRGHLLVLKTRSRFACLPLFGAVACNAAVALTRPRLL